MDLWKRPCQTNVRSFWDRVAAGVGGGGALSGVAPSHALNTYFEKCFVSKCNYSLCVSVILFVGWLLANVSIAYVVHEVVFQYR